MKDATDLCGRRKVKFTILPGLFVNEGAIKNGKILVFCENKDFKINNNPIFKNIPKVELKIEGTFKIEDIKKNITCEIKSLNGKKNGNEINIEVITNYEIPTNDYPKYSIISRSSNKEIKSCENIKTFNIKKDFLKYPGIIGAVELKGVKIDTSNYLVYPKVK